MASTGVIVISQVFIGLSDFAKAQTSRRIRNSFLLLCGPSAVYLYL